MDVAHDHGCPMDLALHEKVEDGVECTGDFCYMSNSSEIDFEGLHEKDIKVDDGYPPIGPPVVEA